MGSDWLDELWEDDGHVEEEGTEDFYCPYTNGTECPIITKGWQPQEICSAIECDQLKLVQGDINRRRDEAA